MDFTDAVSGAVLAGQDKLHPGRGFRGGGIDGFNERMGMWRPQYIAVNLAVQVDVVDILSLTHQKFRIFRARHGLSNTELHVCIPSIWGLSLLPVIFNQTRQGVEGSEA